MEILLNYYKKFFKLDYFKVISLSGIILLSFIFVQACCAGERKGFEHKGMPQFSAPEKRSMSYLRALWAPFIKKHYKFYFDINRTLIAADAGAGKAKENIIASILSDKYKEKWDDSVKEPIIFANYVKEYVQKKYPRDEKTKIEMEQREIKVDFIAYAKDRNHKTGDAFKELWAKVSHTPEIESILEAVHKNAVDLNANPVLETGEVFQSFYNLIDYLDSLEIKYTIILRTFGDDLEKVKNMIEAKTNLKFSRSGQFTHGMNGEIKLELGKFTEKEKDGKKILVLTQVDETIDGINNIYQFIKNSPSGLALRDEYAFWNKMHKQGMAGKVFPFNSDDQDVCSTFFDDNAELGNSPDEENIINAVDVKSGQSIPLSRLQGCNHVFQVDTEEAVLDPMYYIKLVESTLSRVKGFVTFFSSKIEEASKVPEKIAPRHPRPRVNAVEVK